MKIIEKHLKGEGRMSGSIRMDTCDKQAHAWIRYILEIINVNKRITSSALLTHSLNMGNVVERAATPLTPELHEERDRAHLVLAEGQRWSV